MSGGVQEQWQWCLRLCYIVVAYDCIPLANRGIARRTASCGPFVSFTNKETDSREDQNYPWHSAREVLARYIVPFLQQGDQESGVLATRRGSVRKQLIDAGQPDLLGRRPMRVEVEDGWLRIAHGAISICRSGFSIVAGERISFSKRCIAVVFDRGPRNLHVIGNRASMGNEREGWWFTSP